MPYFTKVNIEKVCQRFIMLVVVVSSGKDTDNRSGGSSTVKGIIRSLSPYQVVVLRLNEYRNR